MNGHPNAIGVRMSEAEKLKLIINDISLFVQDGAMQQISFWNVPQDVSNALSSWLDENGIPEEGPNTHAEMYRLTYFNGERQLYVGIFEGAGVGAFIARVLIEKDVVLGASIDA